MSSPKVSVILLSSRREKELVLECISSLKKTEYPKEFLDIILVDNKSEDDVVSEVRKLHPEITIIENKENIGFAAGNNCGIFYALKKGAEYIMILNNDTVQDTSWLLELLKVFSLDTKIGCVTSKIFLYDQPDIINTDGNVIQFLGFAYCGNYKKKDIFPATASHRVTYPSGAAMLVKREVFERLGGFEEKLFIYHDDVEFGWRMNMAGYQTYIAPKSRIFHKYTFLKPSNRKFFLMERNRLIVLFENYKIPTILLLLPALVVMECGILLYALFKGWFFAKCSSYIYFLKPKNILLLIDERKKKQLLRTVSDRKILSLFVGVIEFEDLKSPLLQNIANPLMSLYWRCVRNFIFW